MKNVIICIIILVISFLIGNNLYIGSQRENDESVGVSREIIEKENEIILEEAKVLGTGAIDTE